ncbi:hypothetical protein OPT61_g6491 [Boeremia exigua]|uniref:Uncharacterized protein n=1 Tax=Boeremia exigua TaxID=749465 RepID=A0ACC2I6F6_9PLEO|nr:hypothetical protein OPT61_g6491 [Boeremia exigua]
MADSAVDPQIVDIVSRLQAVETAVTEASGKGKSNSSIRRTKRLLNADLAALKAKIASLDDSDNSDDGLDTASDSGDTPTEIIPRLNKVNWTQFMNSVSGESQYTIDVLIGQVKTLWQRKQETLHLIEDGLTEQQLDQHLPNLVTNLPDGLSDSKPISATHESIEQHTEVPERIRINCKKLLATLRDVAGASNLSSGSAVLLRPYKFLVRHEKALRQRCYDLDVRHDSTEQEHPQQHHMSSGDINAAQEDPEIQKKTSVEHNTELEGLKCLLEFMDTYLMPVYQRYRSELPKKISFRNLWYLYRPGDIVVTRTKAASNKNIKLGGSVMSKGSSIQSGKDGPPALWRVLSGTRGRPDLSTLHGSAYSFRPAAPAVNHFRIQCYAITYDGSSYGPIEKVLEIAPFEGERDISTLNPCPARYIENFTEIKAQIRDRGEKFVQYTKPTHCRYVGSTLSEYRIGIPCTLGDKNTVIDGHVIVDFKEARHEDEAWVLTHGLPEADGGSALEVKEDCERWIYSDRMRKERVGAVSDNIYDDDGVDQEDWDDFTASNTFLAAYKRSSSKWVDHEGFEDIDFALLPDCVVGYDLYRHKFAILMLDHLQPQQVNTDGWKDLELPPGHKTMLRAQIRTHFLRKQLRESQTTQSTDIDLVRGKGLGLIILLHGAPGVGKTSTAECVAESLGKPLYPITCGDLGVTAESVEATLARTFAKAEAWDCVLLLDEADVFLAQRTRTDLVRNGIVSVFLRVLEYYKGTLILTTNRVGAFDEAFKSRIHLNLYYPALDETQTHAIWKMNMNRVIKRKQGRVTADEDEIMQFAKRLFDYQCKRGTRWNGRQIRNAFQTALAMAEFEVLPDEGMIADWDILEKIQSRLKVAHFKTVADASREFDAYIEETIGRTDADRARDEQIRADSFERHPPVNARDNHRNAQWSHGPPGHLSEPHPQSAPDFFARSAGFNHSSYHTSQDTASVQAYSRQDLTWSSPQQPGNGRGLSPAPLSQKPEASQQYIPREIEPLAWGQKQDRSEPGFSNLGRGQFDDGWQSSPQTPSNRGQRLPTHRHVRPGTSDSLDDDLY